MNFSAQQGAGRARGGSPADFSANASPDQRGGLGAEPEDIESSATPGNPHSSAGFRRALEKSQRSSGNLTNLVSKQNFSGSTFRKPSQFAQGGKRHGMHIGSGAPAINRASLEGADV